MYNKPPDHQERTLALDISHSCIVQAPAGSGKTTLLAERYVNLLAKVSRPEEILAITFTRKAAAEMRERVLTILAGDTPAAVQVRQRALAFDWRIGENPNVLKIQTIDSFALDLVSQLSGPDPRQLPRICDYPQKYYEQAIDDVIHDLYRDDATAEVIAEFLAQMDNNQATAARLSTRMLARREQWLPAVSSMASPDNHDHLVTSISQSIERLWIIYGENVLSSLTHGDWSTLEDLSLELTPAARFARNIDAARSVFLQLLNRSGQLRKRVTRRDGVSDRDAARSASSWLRSLHDRGLAEEIEILTRLPEREVARSERDQLHLTSLFLGLLAARLHEHFERDGCIDFNGLLLRAMAALYDGETPTDLALALDYRIKHLLIDEFQDTSRAQAEFFLTLVREWTPDEGNTFFAVGDPMQSIYRFRDADVAIFSEIQAAGIASLTPRAIQLQANFRSARQVVEWNNTLFRTLFGSDAAPDLGQIPYTEAIPVLEASERYPVQCVRFSDTANEIDATLDRIHQLLKDPGSGSIAVLCRSRGHITDILTRLTSDGIAYRATEMELLRERPVVQDLMSLHRVLFRPQDRLAWYSVLRGPMFGTTLATLTELSLSGKPVQESVPERLAEAVQWAREHRDALTIREIVEGAWMRCGGRDAYTPSCLADAEDWFDLLEKLGYDGEDPATVDMAVAELYARSLVPARVEVMTIHRAKGLEFDHVLLPFLHKQSRTDEPDLLSWRPDRAGLLMGIKGDPVHNWLAFEEKQKNQNEEKRLLYVACTRAIHSLYASFTAPDETNATGLARWLTDEVVSPAANEQVTITELIASSRPRNTLRRLPATYVWHEPGPSPISAGLPHPAASDHIGGRIEVATGILVHQALAWMAEQQKFDRSDWERHFPRWSAALAVDGDEVESVLANAVRHLQTTVNDQEGRWVLAAHDDSEAEFALASTDDGTPRTIVIDRMFVDEGTRWIVDYKTAEQPPDMSTSEFIDTQKLRYQSQLNHYAEVASHLYEEPVRTALYLTTLPALIPVS